MSFASILAQYPDCLEARIILALQKKRREIAKISSELRDSANLPPKDCRGKICQPENLESKLRFRFKRKLPFHVLFSLACISWWLDEEQELGSTIRFLIQDEVKRFPHYGWRLELALSSKAELLLYLQEKYYGREHDIFSHIITTKWSWIERDTGVKYTRTLFEISPIVLWYEKSKPKKLQRKRGYRDHGSLGDPSAIARRSEQLKDYSSTVEQERIELERRERRNVFELVRGWFQ